jgi:non-heme chloroperoxidase
MTPASNSIELSTGVTLPYVEQGDPSGVPVLLLHGYTDSWRSFEQTLAQLPESIHAIAPSQRGHGDADRPATGYLAQDFAADAVALIDALELGPAVVAGTSMGSWVAQRAAIDYPEHVRGLVLMGSFGPARENSAVLALWEAVSTLEDPVATGFVRDFQDSATARPLAEARLDMFVAESLKLPARVWKATCERFLEIDWSDELSGIDAPTLLVWGDQDTYATRGEQEVLAGAISDARLLVYRGAGHAMHWEEPERFAADLSAFAHRVVTETDHATV